MLAPILITISSGIIATFFLIILTIGSDEDEDPDERRKIVTVLAILITCSLISFGCGLYLTYHLIQFPNVQLPEVRKT